MTNYGTVFQYIQTLPPSEQPFAYAHVSWWFNNDPIRPDCWAYGVDFDRAQEISMELGEKYAAAIERHYKMQKLKGKSS
jgi:hypothetical protein